MEKKKILLLGAGFTSSNMGLWALATGAITAAWHAHPGAAIHILDYYHKPTQYHVRHSGGVGAVRLINIRFSKTFWLPNNIARLILTAILIKIIPSKQLRKQLYSRNHWLRHIYQADMVGSIAGGDSFSDIYGMWRLVYVTLPQILVLIMGKKLILLPQTIGPFKRSVSKLIARRILSAASLIYSRDHAGFDQVRRLLGAQPDKVRFCHDMGFAVSPYIAAERKPKWLTDTVDNTPLIGLNISGLLTIGGYTGDNMFGLNSDYHITIHAIIDHLVRSGNTRILLVPHVLDEDKGPAEGDIKSCQKFYNEAKEDIRKCLYLVENYYDHQELKAIIGHCDLFIGSRMHACIAALSQTIPAVALAYSPKFLGLYSAMGISDLVIDLKKCDNDLVIERLNAIQRRLHYYREHLERNMPKITNSIMRLFV